MKDKGQYKEEIHEERLKKFKGLQLPTDSCLTKRADFQINQTSPMLIAFTIKNIQACL